MRSVLPVVMLTLPLTGCFLLSPFRDGGRNDPPEIQLDGGETIDVFHDEPTEVLIFVDHPSGSDKIESGVIETLEGQDLVAFTRVRDDRWIANVPWAALESIESIDADRQEFTAFAVFETKWGETEDVELTLRARCGGDTLFCDGECRACESCSDDDECIGLTDCFSGGFTTSVEAQCTREGFQGCAGGDVVGETDVILVEYGDRACTSVSRTYVLGELDCTGQYDFPAEFSYRGVCSE